MRQKLMMLVCRPAYVYVWSAALIATAIVLLAYERHLLWKVQEMNLFLYSTLFLKEQMVVPGGLLTWFGTFFTQFFYVPWLGVAMLCCWWLLLMALLKRAFRVADRWALLLLIPVAMLLVSNIDMGYWLYMLKLRGYFFVSAIGATVVAALLWMFRSIADHSGKCGSKLSTAAFYLLPFLASAIGYPLFGIYGLAATLLMGILSWRLPVSRTAAVVCSLVAVVSAIAVPLFCYRYIYYQVNLANVYWAELPLFFITENHPTYYIPYYLLALFFVVLAVTYSADRTVSATGKSGSKAPVIHSSLFTGLCQAVVVVAIVVGVYVFWMKDENFHRELAMQHHIDNCDWNGVLEEAAAQKDEPTRAIVMMRNLALSRVGKQGDLMFLYKNGSKAYDAPFGMRLMLVAGPLIYYQYGMLNYCNRLCMEMGVEFGFRAEDYQLLVNCALLENDQPLARKYIGILKQTLFYSDWAEQAEALLGHPERIAKDAAREPVTHMLHYKNYLGGDQGNTENFLMSQLAASTYTGDPVFQEQALLATLWTKDIKRFWRRFSDYVSLHPNGPIPRYYQEAAYLYAKMEERPDVNTMPIDASIKDAYERFNSTAPDYAQEDMEVARQGLYPLFGDTYFYDYYLMSELPEY